MSTPTKKSRRATRPTRGSVAAVPLTDASASHTKLAQRLDDVAVSGLARGRKWTALQSDIVSLTVRDQKIRGGSPFLKLGRVFDRLAWPKSLYVPRNDAKGFGLPKPPADHLYSDQWTGGTGVASADRDQGTIFVFAGVPTTETAGYADGGLGIRYSPQATLSYVRYEPEVSCAVVYRMFVDFWPTLVAGDVRARGSLFVGAWLLNPVLGGSFELVSVREVPVFDTLQQNAGSNVWPTTPTQLKRDFTGSALSTTYLVQGGRTYLFGVVARAQVRHNLTNDHGKVLPQDASRFKLYADLTCSVPFMSVFEQTILVP